MWKTILNKYTWDFDWFNETSYEEEYDFVLNAINNNTININTFSGRLTLVEDKIDLIEWWVFEQWIWLLDSSYLYVIYWVDEDWIVIRDTLDLVTQTDTWQQTWTKPTTLAEVQLLTYN